MKAGKNDAENVALVDEAFMTEFKDFTLQHAIENIEVKDLQDEDMPDDVIPTVAQDMGSGRSRMV